MGRLSGASFSNLRAMNPERTNRMRQAGFTLIEAIIAIVITGIISSMVAIFIKSSIDSYFAAERRAELTEVADLVLRRLSREVRLALPNSLRVATVANVAYIEFIPTSDGGRYRDTGDGSTGGNVLDFAKAAFEKCYARPVSERVIGWICRIA